MNDLQIDLVDPVMSHYPHCFSEIPTSGENLPKAISSQLVIIKQNRAPPACINLQYFAIVFLKLSRKKYLSAACLLANYLSAACLLAYANLLQMEKEKGKKNKLMKVTKIGFLGVRNFVFLFFFVFFCFFAFLVSWFFVFWVSWFLGFLVS